MIPTLAEIIDGQEVMHVSLPMLGAFTASVIAAIGAIFLRGQRREQRLRESIRIDPPLPDLDVITHESPQFVTQDIFSDHMLRIERTFGEIKVVLDKERDTARTSNGNVHKRIDAMSERLGDRLSRVEGTTIATNETVSKLLDIALGKKITTRP